MFSSYLGIELAAKRTRAWLYDDQSGAFKLTEHIDEADFGDKRQMIFHVIDQLEKKSEQKLQTDNARFAISKDKKASGLKGVGISYSFGKPIRAVLVGISEKYSIAPLRRLLRFFNVEIVLELDLQKEPNVSNQLEKMITTACDLVVVAGGVDGGPEKALRAVINNLRLVAQLWGKTNRPQVVYAGNQALADYAKLEIEIGDDLHLAGNIQPESGREDLSFAVKAVLKAVERIRLKEFPELQVLLDDPEVRFVPSEFARARIDHWLEQTQINGKGVLHIHLEPDHGHVTAIKDGLRMGFWQSNDLDQIQSNYVKFLSNMPVNDFNLASYIRNKQLYPSFLPATIEDLNIEFAMTCHRIQKLLQGLSELYDQFNYDPELGLIGDYEPILLSGSSLTKFLPLRNSFMAVLDGILPRGITTFVLDDYQLICSLGVLGEIESMLPTQIVDSNVFSNLGTIINVVSPISVGWTVLRMEIDEGDEEYRQHYQVKQSELKRVETLSEQDVRVYLAPGMDTDVGMGMPGLGGWVNTSASELGVIVDARGRPLYVPTDESSREELVNDWLWEMGV